MENRINTESECVTRLLRNFSVHIYTYILAKVGPGIRLLMEPTRNICGFWCDSLWPDFLWPEFVLCSCITF